MPGNPHHECREDQRHNDAFDQSQKQGGDNLELHGRLGKLPAHKNPGDHRQDNPLAQ